MSEQAATPHMTSDDHHDDPWSHVPPPSFWPFALGASLIFFMVTTVMGLLGLRDGEGLQVLDEPNYGVIAGPLVIVSIICCVFTGMGWCHQIIKEKRISHDLTQQQSDLKFFVKMFLVSELTAFLAVFAYYYIRYFLNISGKEFRST